MRTTIFGKLKQESTSEKIYNAIRGAIFTGGLKTGQRLTEVPLARELQVSRASLREALQRLSYEGLVESNSYKGTRVVELTPEQLDEVLALRLLLEAEAVRQAKKRLSEADKQALLGLARKLQSPNISRKVYPSLDLELHQKIWEISGNRTLQKHLKLLVSPLFAMGTILRYSEIGRQPQPECGEAPVDHLHLVEVICEGTKEQAVEAMKAHIADNWKVTRSRIEDFLKDRSIPLPAGTSA